MNGFEDSNSGSGSFRRNNRRQWIGNLEDTMPESNQFSGIGWEGMGFAARMHQLPDDRKQLIFRIRRQIAESTYDTPEKLELAMERMLGGLLDHED